MRSAAVNKSFGHGAGHFARARRLRAGNAEGVRGLVFIESEHARGSGGGTEDSGSAGDVPMRVMREPDGVGDAAFDFDADDERQ